MNDKSQNVANRHEPHKLHEGDDVVVHRYGDIEEYDNHLPNWWLWTLYGAIIFAAGYWFYYHGFSSGELPAAELRREVLETAQRSGKGADATSLTALAGDPGSVQQGKEMFVAVCGPCHAPTAGGTIGPNLTDEYWIHGGDPLAIYKVVKTGIVAKGMPAWGPQLGEAKVQAVTAYVLSIRNTNVPGGKAPQGEKFAAAQ